MINYHLDETLYNHNGGIINNSGILQNDNYRSHNSGVINNLLGGSITGSQAIGGAGSISYSPTLSGANNISGSQGGVGAKTIMATLSASHNTEEITLTATIGGKSAMATKTGDGTVTFSFATPDLNALAVGSYPIMISAPATTNNKAIVETQVGTLTVLATDKEITSFSLDGSACTISGTNISLAVPHGTHVTIMTPTITHSGASVSPASGVAQNFTNSVTYTVTGADGTTKQYIVTVTIDALTPCCYTDRFRLDCENGR